MPNIIITRDSLSAQDADKENAKWEKDYKEAKKYVEQGAPYSEIKKQFGDTGDTAMMAKGKMDAETGRFRTPFIT